MAKVITPQSLFTLLQSQSPITLVDVRTPEEYARGSLYESINIPVLDIPRKASSLRKAASVVTFCNYGAVSRKAAGQLAAKGIPSVALEGGLKAWNAMYDVVPIPERGSSLTLYQVKRLGKGCLSYIVVLPDNTSVIIIDPSHHTETYTAFLKTHHWNAVAIVDTHIHTDHLSGGRLLAKNLSAPYLLPKGSVVEFPFDVLEERLPKLAVGASITFYKTPGHTPESVSILFDELFLISGDTLFVDAISHTSPGNDQEAMSKQLYTSITSILFSLKDPIHILPAHTAQPMIPGPLRSATLRYVKLFNQIKEFPTAKAFSDYLRSHPVASSPAHQTITAYNRAKTVSKTVDVDELELLSNTFGTPTPDMA